MILALLILPAFLFPLALYCLLLAQLNRRTHPVMVPGPWDFAGVLFAASGFLLVGGPVILSRFNQRSRELWLYSRPLHALHGLGAGRGYWFALAALYVVAVVGLSLFVLWVRRYETSVYNVEPASFEEALARALDRLKLQWWRTPNRWTIAVPYGVEDNPDGIAPTAEPPQSPEVSHAASRVAGEETTLAQPSPATHPGKPVYRAGFEPAETIALELNTFPALRHVTLRWPEDAGPWRREIEEELDRTLQRTPTADNPAGPWFLTLAAGLFTLVFIDLLALLFLLYRANL